EQLHPRPHPRPQPHRRRTASDNTNMHPNRPSPGTTRRRVVSHPRQGGAKSECYNPTTPGPRRGQIRGEQWGHLRVLRPPRTTAPLYVARLDLPPVRYRLCEATVSRRRSSPPDGRPRRPVTCWRVSVSLWGGVFLWAFL